MSRFSKSVADVLDYPIDWALWLAAGETIVTSAWAATPGITIASSSQSQTTATVWLSGGKEQDEYQIANTITTSAGRTRTRGFTLAIAWGS
jgi:hypothetical protein